MKESLPSPSLDSTPRIQLSWLITLRWGAMLGQLLTIGTVRYGFHVDTPLVPLTLLIALTMGTNLIASRWLAAGRTVSDVFLGTLLALDICLLTGLLYWSGGPVNPFSLLYFVHVTLAAVTLRPVWAWGLVALSAVSYRLLFFAQHSTEHDLSLGLHAPRDHYSLHLEGMWISFVIASTFIAYFVLQVSAALQRRERELATVRNLATRNERLASLATMAAGAAHELGSPLATIAVVAKELEHTLSNLHLSNEIVEDTRLIRSQVHRCHTILEQLSAGAGQVLGEPLAPFSLAALVEDVHDTLTPHDVARLHVTYTQNIQLLHIPRRALVRALVNLLRNALEASPVDALVALDIKAHNNQLIFSVRDTGPGMPPDLLTRVGEPFFSTKAPDKGMGLGIFLARNLAEQLGGTLAFDSIVDHGTTAILTLPRHPSAQLSRSEV